MFKKNHHFNNAEICYPDSLLTEPLAVTEIGRATPAAGFETGACIKNTHILQYIISGKCRFNGITVHAPALIYIRQGAYYEYAVDSGCHDFLTLWITCAGERSTAIFHDVGFGNEHSISTISYSKKVVEIFNLIMSEEEYSGSNDRLVMMSGLLRLLALETTHQSPKETKFLTPYTKSVLDYIHQNYSKNISEKDLASVTNLSTNYMHKVFLNDMSITPINYLNAYRIDCAKKRLSDTDLPISAIASAVGISGSDYFCRVFRKFSNDVSPSVFRKYSKFGIINIPEHSSK